MTADELVDIRAMAESLRRIERKVDDQAVRSSRFEETQTQRTDKLERAMDRIDGALTVTKWALSFLGASGVVALVLALGSK